LCGGVFSAGPQRLDRPGQVRGEAGRCLHSRSLTLTRWPLLPSLAAGHSASDRSRLPGHGKLWRTLDRPRQVQARSTYLPARHHRLVQPAQRATSLCLI
jgi:hypothetical protein